MFASSSLEALRDSCSGASLSSLVRMLAALAVLCVFAEATQAQSVQVEATVSDNTIGAEERVQYTISITGTSLPSVSTPDPPETEGLALASRFPSTSRNISLINGAMTQSVSFSWAFAPVGEGEARFKPHSIPVGTDSYTVDPITINVVAQSNRPARQPARRPSVFDPFAGLDQGAAEPAPLEGSDIFIRAAPTKRRAFQNEQITIEYGLYFRAGIQLRQSRLADSWDAEGFWREELDVESRPIPESVVENGVRYNKIVLKRVSVFPTRSGDLTIDPLRIESEASASNGRRDPFFSLRNRYQPIELASQPVRIESRPLPEAPPEFRGAVGNFDLNASLSVETVGVGESVELSVTISGSGNMATLDEPILDAPGVFEVYDPQISTSINRGGRSVRGSKSFDYILVPRSNGTFEIPSIRLTYFDPQRQEYRTEQGGPFTIAVTGTAANASTAVATTGGGLPVDDIPPIKVSDDSWRRVEAAPLYRSPLPYTLMLVPIIGLCGVLFFRKHSARLAGDTEYARKKRAHPLAKKHLKNAESLLAGNDAKGYYAELERAVLSFVGNQLNVGERALTRDELEVLLGRQGVDQDAIGRLRNLLDECDRVRFAPVSPDKEAMDTAHERAADIIVRLHEAVTKPTDAAEKDVVTA